MKNLFSSNRLRKYWKLGYEGRGRWK